MANAARFCEFSATTAKKLTRSRRRVLLCAMGKKLTAGIGAGLLLLLLGSGTALARDLNGAIGVGGTTSLTGATGIALNYFFTPKFGIEGVFGLNVFSPDGGDSTTELNVGASVLYNLWSADNVMLHADGSIALNYIDEADSGTQFAFGGGLRGEYFVTQNFSLFVETGLIVSIIPETGDHLEDNLPGGLMEGTLIGINTDVYGNGGFTVWFK
jgi:hypothetical protein